MARDEHLPTTCIADRPLLKSTGLVYQADCPIAILQCHALVTLDHSAAWRNGSIRAMVLAETEGLERLASRAFECVAIQVRICLALACIAA